MVYNGTYNEILTINRSISLISFYKNSTIKYFDNQTSISLIKIYSSNCTIDGFKIIGNNSSIGIEISSTSHKVANNIVTNLSIQNMDYGIHIINSNYNTVSNNIIENNNYGLLISNSNYNNIIMNNFSKNNIYGIYLLFQSKNNKFNNNIIYSNSNGLRVKDSQKNIFEKNIFLNNDEMGVYICCEANDNIFYNNSFINNNPNVEDPYNNKWHYNGVGNYWDDYIDIYPQALDLNNDGKWDIPYEIYRETKDLYPLVKPIEF